MQHFFSNTSHYALGALLELVNSGPLSSREIAKRREIPLRFLERILKDLKEAGLVQSSRGKEGGYFLTRSPLSISVAEVIKLMQASSFRDKAVGINGASINRFSAISALDTEATQALFSILEATNLETLSLSESETQALNFSI